MAIYRMKPEFDHRPNGWRILNLFGIPVYIEPSFLLFIGIIFLMSARGGPIDLPAVGLFCFVIFFSILIHEFGHAVVSRLSGCQGIRIALVMFGGYCTHSPTTRGRSILICLAGPAFGVALGLAAWGVGFIGNGAIYRIGPEGAMGLLIGWLVFINVFWSLLNLIPIHPLDGGQTLFHALTYRFDPNRSMAIVARVSMVACVVVGLLAVKFGFMFGALFCAMFFMDNMRIHQSVS